MSKNFLKGIIDEDQHMKYFHVLSGIYIAGMLVSITVSARLVPVHVPFINRTILLTGGTWTIPITFFIQDIITEVYGYSKSKAVVFLAIPIVVFYVLYLKITTFFSIPRVHNIEGSYNDVFNALPRHLVAFIAAILIGNLVNNRLLSLLKSRFKGKYLPFRFIFSTAVGEAMLQIVGTTIAWFGRLQFTTQIIPFIVVSYIYKVFFEVMMTPFNVFLSSWLKRNERIDVYE